MPVSVLNPEKQHFLDSIGMAMDLAESVAVQLRAVGENLKTDDMSAAAAHDAATKTSHIRALLREAQTEVKALEAMTDMNGVKHLSAGIVWQFGTVIHHTELIRLRQLSAIDHQNVARFDIDTTGLTFAFPYDQKAAAIDYADQGGSKFKPSVVETAPAADHPAHVQEVAPLPATPLPLNSAPLVESDDPPPLQPEASRSLSSQTA